ncbi:protein FAM199X-B-like [Antedon mediterranea]|uniref:protein FAM199X-B-like n=1 Tax=Antedon mediterranea TaxID=105859 RepID=UPI003AF623DA
MIAEYLTGISTSPWNTDHFYDDESHDIPKNSLNYYDSMLTSRGTSRRTSECSDREDGSICLDTWYPDYESVVVQSANTFLPDVTLVNDIDHDEDNYKDYESSLGSSLHISDDDLSSRHLTTDEESEDEDDEIYPSPKKTKRNLQDVTWSEMSNEEHIRTIEQLISLISEQMSLRDQLEIIRIIRPNAEVSPTDNEFTIELEWLTDEKLHRIRDYITHTVSPKVGNSKLIKEDSDEQEEDEEDCSTKSKSKKRRCMRSANERRQQMRAQRLRQRKENKQAVKEKKSGLFRHEKVLSVQRCQENTEEVDILG